MLKKILGSAVALSMLLPLAVSAASVPATAVFNGQTQVYGNPNQTIQVTLRVNASSGEVPHAILTDFIGDNKPTVCHDIANFEGAQNKDVVISETLPPNTGDYGYVATVYSTTNVAAADALTGDTACATVTGNTAGPVFSPGTVVHVIPTGSTPPVGTPSFQTQLDALSAQISALVQAMAHPVVPAPTNSVVCQAYKDAKVGTQMFVYNNANIAFQGFLLSQHQVIPALAAGASFGYYGNQTASADASFQSVNHCQ